MVDSSAQARRALAEAVAALPAEQRAALPVDDTGEPRAEIVRALYRYERSEPGVFRWIEVGELAPDAWDDAIAAHAAVHRVTRGFDSFLSFAWGDLKNVREELLRQLRDQTRPNEWMAPLVEYRILNFSSGLRMYHERVEAEAERLGDGELKQRISQGFSEVYDRSFGYRLLYSMRNAFLHGARGLITLHMVARATGEDLQGRESLAYARLRKDRFANGKSNAAVRQQVRTHDGEIDLLELSSEAFAEIEELHRWLSPLLHPEAPDAARLLGDYMGEIGGERAYFHEYIRGLPHVPLSTHSVDRLGFAYVVSQLDGRAEYEEGAPSDAVAMVPRYAAEVS